MRFLAKEMRARDISLHFLFRSPNTSPPGILITAAAAEEGDENVRAPRRGETFGGSFLPDEDGGVIR